jgi:hypothetical protein
MFTMPRRSIIDERLLKSTKSLPGNRRRTRRKESRGKIQYVAITQMALFVFLLMSSQAHVSFAYPTEYPKTIFGRIQNPSYCGRDMDTAYRQLLQRKNRLGRLRGSEFNPEDGEDSSSMSEIERDLMRRISRLEALVSKQEVEIYRLRKENEELKVTSSAFAKVLQVLRDASGRDSDDSSKKISDSDPAAGRKEGIQQTNRVVESFDDSMIFGVAPASVNDAADAAGAAILAAMLAGKQRMLVDVRDAELSSDPETLVQFIELAILPVAAGLEGLKSTRNRVKIVFPKVSQLLEYRRTMALAAPEVVALSTLGFDPVERRDKLVVIVAPQPDDEEGLNSMRELLYPPDERQAIEQPVVILNYHMLPVSLPPLDFETAYHLRLLSVQYMTGTMANELLEAQAAAEDDMSDAKDGRTLEAEVALENGEPQDTSLVEEIEEIAKEEQLEAAMKHAHEIGMNIGVTRAMVIRSYPRYVILFPSSDYSQG